MRNLIVNDWIDYLDSIKGNSSNTIKSYENDINNFLQYIKYRKELTDKPIDDLLELPINDVDEHLLNEINVRDIISFIGYTDKYLNNSASTRYRKTLSIKNFFNYLYKIVAIIDNNPMDLIDVPKIPRRLPHYLELNEVKKLLEVVLEHKDPFYRYRDYCILMVFLNTGLRLNELVNIKISDLHENKAIRIIGKGNKERLVYLNESVKESLTEYKNLRPDSDLDYLFLNKKGTSNLGSRGIQYMVTKYLKACGLGGKYSPHSLRHTAATLLFQYGDVDIRTLQMILGHESVSTTQIYTHVSEKKLQEAVELNPIKDLKIEKK